MMLNDDIQRAAGQNWRPRRDALLYGPGRVLGHHQLSRLVEFRAIFFRVQVSRHVTQRPAQRCRNGGEPGSDRDGGCLEKLQRESYAPLVSIAHEVLSRTARDAGIFAASFRPPATSDCVGITRRAT